MKDKTPEETSEHMGWVARQNRGKTPWRCGPICPTRKAHDKFKADHVQVDRRVAGITRYSRMKG